MHTSTIKTHSLKGVMIYIYDHDFSPSKVFYDTVVSIGIVIISTQSL